MAWIVVPFALMLSLSIAGIGSAWMGGSARIPFVAGLDSYMPAWLGKLHPRYATPYAALIVQGLVSLLLVMINFAAAGGVQEAFQTMLSLAVVLQLVPFLYMFAALLKFSLASAKAASLGEGRYGRTVLMLAGASGLLTTVIAIVVAFFPASQISRIEVRIEDVRPDPLFHRAGRIFLFCVRTTKAQSGQCSGRRRPSTSVRPSGARQLKEAFDASRSCNRREEHTRCLLTASGSRASGKTFPVYDPSTEEIIAQVPDANAEDVDRAVAAARAAFDNGPWATTTAQERGRVLFRLAEKMRQKPTMLAELNAEIVASRSSRRSTISPMSPPASSTTAAWPRRLPGM